MKLLRIIEGNLLTGINLDQVSHYDYRSEGPGSQARLNIYLTSHEPDDLDGIEFFGDSASRVESALLYLARSTISPLALTCDLNKPANEHAF